MLYKQFIQIKKNIKLLSSINKQSFATRDEQEVAGYAKLMDTIFADWEVIPLSENYIKQLHKILLQFSSKDEKGKFECIVFNGPKKINSFGYDYILDRSGNIYKKSDYDLFGNNTSQKIPVVGRVSKAQMQQITKTLENQIENSNKK